MMGKGVDIIHSIILAYVNVRLHDGLQWQEKLRQERIYCGLRRNDGCSQPGIRFECNKY